MVTGELVQAGGGGGVCKEHLLDPSAGQSGRALYGGGGYQPQDLHQCPGTAAPSIPLGSTIFAGTRLTDTHLCTVKGCREVAIYIPVMVVL